MLMSLSTRGLVRHAFLATTASLLLSAALHAQPIDDIIAQGDVCDVKLEAAKALEYYREAEKMEPDNAGLMVRMARQYRHLMQDASSKSEKLKLGNISLDYGRRAAALAPKDSEAQLSTAISYGKMLPLQGSREQIEASKRIKEAADKAIKLNPENDLAWHIAGRWSRGIAEVGSIKRALASIVYEKMPSATFEDAIRCFQKALEINPHRVIHYIEIGRTYAQMGRENDARRYLQKGLAMPSTEKDDPDAKRTGRELLAKL